MSSRCVPEYIQSADFFQSNTSNFIVKNTFKATCFGSTEPSSGLFVRTDPYLITSTDTWDTKLDIKLDMNLFLQKKAWWWLCRAETCHLECVFNNKVGCVWLKKSALCIYRLERFHLMRCDAIWFGRWVLTFWRNLLPS